MSSPAFTASVVFATVTGATTAVLAALAYGSFGGSPFGRLVALLGALGAGFAVYHAALLVVGTAAFPAVEAAVFTGLALFALWMVRLHRRMAPRPRVSGDGDASGDAHESDGSGGEA